jgi:hypothetical protein
MGLFCVILATLPKIYAGIKRLYLDYLG